MLLITITDNGIGRGKAAELKSRTVEKNKSFGTKITSERIALINEKYHANAQVSITDLFHEDGEPSGTSVIIKLPIN